MDPALLKDRAKFMARAAATPSVSAKRKTEASSSSESTKQKAKRSRITAASLKADTAVVGTTTSLSANFGVLAKIVDHMKKRHLDGNIWGLSLDEILEEIQVFDLPKATYKWLTEALPSNRRIMTDDQKKYLYRPPYKIKGKKTLVAVLKRRDLEGQSGILMSEIADCIPNPEKAVEAAGTAVSVILTNINKRKDKVLFYNDADSVIEFNEGMESKGFRMATSVGPKRRTKKGVMLNEHMQGVLHDYSLP